MPKQTGPISLKGKMGNITFTDGKTGKRARKSAEFSEEQKEQARKRPQVVRTGILNNLGKALKDVLKACNYDYVPPAFWSKLLKAFRREQTNHRILLLQQLTDIEIDINRPFSGACPLPEISMKTSAKKYSFDIDISRPATVSKDYNCYFLQFILVVWNRYDKAVRFDEHETEWLKPNDRSPKFITLDFKRTTADTERLLVCRFVQGCNHSETGYVTDCRIRVVDVGTVSKESLKILGERAAENDLKKGEGVKKTAVKVKKKVAVRRER